MRKESKAGLTKIDLLIVLGALALLAGVVLVGMSRSRAYVQRINCASTVKAIACGARMFSNDHRERLPMQLSKNEGGSAEYSLTGQVFRHFQVLSNELVSPKVLVCPADYSQGRQRALDFGATFGNQNISYFTGIDASETNPYSLLLGDRNLQSNVPSTNGVLCLTPRSQVGWDSKLHRYAGNVGLGDGSSVWLANSDWPETLQKTKMPLVRLAIPE